MVDLGYDPTMGARPLRRTIQDQIEDGIAEYFLDHPATHHLSARLEDDKIVVKAAEEIPASDDQKADTTAEDETPAE